VTVILFKFKLQQFIFCLEYVYKHALIYVIPRGSRPDGACEVYHVRWCTSHASHTLIDCVWNVMAHAQKPDFAFRRSRRVHLNRWAHQFSRLLAGEMCTSVCRVCTVRASLCSAVMTLTGYPLHSVVSPSLLLLCVTVCHHISAGLYFSWIIFFICIYCIFLSASVGWYSVCKNMHERSNKIHYPVHKCLPWIM